MTDRELMQMALDALEKLNKDGWILADFEDEVYASIEALRARLAQPEQELICVAFIRTLVDIDKDGIETWKDEPLYTAPPHFLDPAKVARLIDEAFERGKKEIDMEQVKDIAQKLADCAVLNSAPPQREWQDLTGEEEDAIWDECLGVFDCLKMTQAKLKEKNNA